MSKRLVSLYDIHLESRIKDKCLSILNPVLQFVKNFKPNVLLIGGDYLNLRYFSKWAEMKPNDLAGNLFDEDITFANEILDRLDKSCNKKDMRKIFLIGNHEEWIWKFLEKYPFLNKVLDLIKELKLKERGYEIVAPNQYAKVGKIYFIHGIYTNLGHAKKHLQVYGKNIRYGHLHTYQIFSKVSPIDFHRRLGISIPCLCDMNPHYMRNRPNKWIQGFHYAYIEDTGEFYENIPIITNGKFMAEGKLYGGVCLA